MFPDMTIELFRPNGTSAVLLVIKHTLQNTVQVCVTPGDRCVSHQATGGYLCNLSLSQVTLGKVLKAIVVMRSLFIDRTVVRGFNENVYNEDGKVSSQSHHTGNVSYLCVSLHGNFSVCPPQLDIWTKSQYQVFQKVRLNYPHLNSCTPELIVLNW